MFFIDISETTNITKVDNSGVEKELKGISGKLDKLALVNKDITKELSGINTQLQILNWNILPEEEKLRVLQYEDRLQKLRKINDENVYMLLNIFQRYDRIDKNKVIYDLDSIERIPN